MAPPRKVSGFSLFSLLVGIAVVAVLATLGLGTYSRAQQQAKAVSCMGNLRQIGVALHSYLADHNGRYPPSRSNVAHKTEDNGFAGVHWQDSLKLYLNPYSGSPVTAEMAGPLWCPADLPRRNGLAQHSYGVNNYIGGAEPPEKQNIRVEPNPGQRLYLVEAMRETRSTCNFSHNTWPFNSGHPSKPDTNIYVDFRHGSIAHGLFLDGRVAGFKVRDLRGQNPSKPIPAP